MAILLVILGLVVIVTVHEFGHFIAAKAVGVRATKFYVFFPPALVKRVWRGVEYGIGSIPLGGFVRLPGMFEPTGKDVHWRLEPQLERITAGVADGVELLRVSAAARSLPAAQSAEQLADDLRELDEALARVLHRQQVAVGPHAGVGIEAYRRRVRRTRRRIGGVIDDCHPQAYWRASLWRRMLVIFAGPAINLVFAYVAFLAFFMFVYANPLAARAEWRVASVRAGSPAEAAGIRKGDRVMHWNGDRSFGTATRFGKLLNRSLGKPVVVELRRAGDHEVYQLRPARIGGKGKPRVGLGFDYVPGSVVWPDPVRRSLGEASALTNSRMLIIAVESVRKLGGFFVGRDLDQASSVVGAVQRAPEADRRIGLLAYFALLNLAIAVFNLLPLLPLDGGHLAFGIVEALRRGRPLPRELFERFSMVGLALVLGLFLIGLGNDLGLRG